MIRRVYVEKKNDVKAKSLMRDLKDAFNLDAEIKRLLRYDMEGVEDRDYQAVKEGVLSEPPLDLVSETLEIPKGYTAFAVEYLPGQYDQRADSAAQCIQLITCGKRPVIRCATVYLIKLRNAESTEGLTKIKDYLVNPVEAREASLEMPSTLLTQTPAPQEVREAEGFIYSSDAFLRDYYERGSFAMSYADLAFVRDYFQKLGRNPTETELKVIDTYWSDHCRHTTFLTEIESVEIDSPNPHIREAFELYKNLFTKYHGTRKDKYHCLMDIATIAVKHMKGQGLLDDLDESEEINACSIRVKLKTAGKSEDYLVMFKNETHNHPTEIEPFGGAATCLGGAIRDPLSGRTYVYQAMRVTGSADPTKPFETTLKGKLPQKVITSTAADGFSSYGNQIGLATGMVCEMYHDNYVAKRLETGFVVGANKAEYVVRETPAPGDIVVLLGGQTGRDGCGGATGSSKAHNLKSVETCGAEVQKGNPLTERKLQRFFRNPKVTKIIKRCNDFGAGGVCVAIGELSEGIDIDLTKVPKKYEGLTGTELAISESQERMAVVIAKENEKAFIELAGEENLEAVTVASVTEQPKMKMRLNGKVIVDIDRAFLNTNGVRMKARALIREGASTFFDTLPAGVTEAIEAGDFEAALQNAMSDLNVCSQKGLSERFDSTIGSGSVYMPFGGKTQLTPALAIAAKIPTERYDSDIATVASWGCDPAFMSDSPFEGSAHSVILSLSKLVASGVDYRKIRLTFQEYFKRLNLDPERFGQPLSALLGALSAECGMGLAAIGGKDSMSGTFESIDVPPTLISFALATEKADRLITNVLNRETELYRLPIRRDRYAHIDYTYLKKVYETVYRLIGSGEIDFATVVERGGIAAATIKSCLGNRLGFEFRTFSQELFRPYLGDLIVSVPSEDCLRGLEYEKVGRATKKFEFGANNVSQKILGETLEKAFTGRLESVFKTQAASSRGAENVAYEKGSVLKKASVKTAHPRVFIPAFPGTNCEYDMAERFRAAGAQPEIFVVRNRTPEEIKESITQMAKKIENCQIIAFPGGFSGGDEPDGSGKFIVAAFRSPAISDSVNRLLTQRDGLMLGICNGFQAIIKLGLIESDTITVQKPSSCTLTYNNIARHVSTVVNVRVSSTLSPWLSAVKVGDVFQVAVSHGEGKFIGDSRSLAKLKANGQIATQYADEHGAASNEIPYNPNGSEVAIEGATSKSGRVFGKMGHSERIGSNLMINCPGNYDMKLFESGVKYFTD